MDLLNVMTKFVKLQKEIAKCTESRQPSGEPIDIDQDYDQAKINTKTDKDSSDGDTQNRNNNR